MCSFWTHELYFSGFYKNLCGFVWVFFWKRPRSPKNGGRLLQNARWNVYSTRWNFYSTRCFFQNEPWNVYSTRCFDRRYLLYYTCMYLYRHCCHFTVTD